jgi:hypothetical protein
MHAAVVQPQPHFLLELFFAGTSGRTADCLQDRQLLQQAATSCNKLQQTGAADCLHMRNN